MSAVSPAARLLLIVECLSDAIWKWRLSVERRTPGPYQVGLASTYRCFMERTLEWTATAIFAPNGNTARVDSASCNTCWVHRDEGDAAAKYAARPCSRSGMHESKAVGVRYRRSASRAYVGDENLFTAAVAVLSLHPVKLR